MSSLERLARLATRTLVAPQTILFLAIPTLFATSSAASAQTVAQSSYSALHWRFVGPLRGGRTVGLSGVAGRPNLFYIAAVNGGIWRTEDAGRTWVPIFDGQPTGSPSDGRDKPWQRDLPANGS